MKKEDLKKAFDLMNDLESTINALEKLNIYVVDSKLFDVPGWLFDMVISSNYTEEGQDWINWFFFEKDGNPDIKAHDENGNEICKDFDDLYEYVKQFERRSE